MEVATQPAYRKRACHASMQGKLDQHRENRLSNINVNHKSIEMPPRPKSFNNAEEQLRLLRGVIGTLQEIVDDVVEGLELGPQARKNKLLKASQTLQTLSVDKGMDLIKPRRKTTVEDPDVAQQSNSSTKSDLTPSAQWKSLLAAVELDHPGVTKIILKNQELQETALQKGFWKESQCYVLHHTCYGKDLGPDTLMLRHRIQNSTCNSCIENNVTNCCVSKNRNEGQEACSYCLKNGLSCLVTDDLKDIYSYLDSICPLDKMPGNQRWKHLGIWLREPTAQQEKFLYLERVANAWIDERTQIVAHPSGIPCKFATGAVKSTDPRTSIKIWCTQPIMHVRFLHQMSYLKILHLVAAYKKHDQKTLDFLLDHSPEISHRCVPPSSLPGEETELKSTRCWEWKHVTFETSKENQLRKRLCHTGLALCRCEPPCLDNGEDGKFVRNVLPVDDSYGYWRPAINGHVELCDGSGQSCSSGKRIKAEDEETPIRDNMLHMEYKRIKKEEQD